MRKKRYKKRISATRRFLLSVVAITMLVINIIIPLQVVVAEFMINEQLNDDGEGTIESEDEVSDDSAESTEPELDVEDSTEDTSVDEPSNVPDDSSSIPKEENTDESIEENGAEEGEQQQESNIVNGSVDSTDETVDDGIEKKSNQDELVTRTVNEVTVASITELRDAINSADSTPLIINISGDISTTHVNEGGIAINGDKDITLRSDNNTQRTITQIGGYRHFTVNGDASLTLDYGITLNGSSRGGGVDVGSGEFTMNSGTVIENSKNVVSIPGGAVTIEGNNSSFIMNGGSIRNNRASIHGGAIGVRSGATFIMNGGSIHNNETTNHGGAVYYQDSGTSVILNDGRISDNTARANGGAIATQGSVSSAHNLSISSTVEFSGNKAKIAHLPPTDVESLFPNIQTTSASIYNHPLNNFDIVYVLGRVLTVSRTPEIGGDVTIEGIVNLEEGMFGASTRISIVATPASGYTFTGWTSSGGDFGNANDANTTFLMPNAAATITANFEKTVGRKFIEIFPDRNLAQVVAEHFERDAEDFVTDKELLGVETLEGNNREIQNLEGIENLKNLITLKLNDNGISDSSMGYISKLSDLVILEMNNNKISDVSELSRLDSLINLRLNDNEINDVSELSKITQLSNLFLNNNGIEDISLLGELTRLQTLHLSTNKISDISALRSLTNLTELQVNENQISDLRPLDKLATLPTTLNVSNQTIQLSSGEIGVPTELKLYNIEGSDPTVAMDAGEYKNGQLTWNIAGNNRATWTGSNGFTGTVTQTVVPGTTLKFENVPDVLEFEETSIPIQNDFMTIKRKESMSLSIRDTRGENSTWYIRVSMDSPFISEDGEHRLPDDALVFKGSDGQIRPLSNDPIEVYSGKTTSESLTIEVSWKEDEGILVHMQTKAAKPDTRYQTSITWTLHNTPL